MCNRDHKGDAKARDPFVPVKAARQREALKFLQDHILTDKPFNFPPELLRKLAADRWLHWGNERAFMRGVDSGINDRGCSASSAFACSNCLHDRSLSHLQDQAAEGGERTAAVTIAEVMRALSDSTFADLPTAADKPAAEKSSIIRRNLQRAYVAELTRQVLRGSVPDARSLRSDALA